MCTGSQLVPPQIILVWQMTPKNAPQLTAGAEVIPRSEPQVITSEN